MKNKEMKPILFLVGKSGSGKDTIANRLEERFNLSSVKSYTTRKKRGIDDKGHKFISKEEFENLNKVAYACFDNNYYCASSYDIEHNDLYIVDLQGIKYFEKFYRGDRKYLVIYLDVSLFARFCRMLKRGDGIANAIRRISHDSKQFKGIEERTNLVIDNKSYKQTARQIYQYWLGL